MISDDISYSRFDADVLSSVALTKPRRCLFVCLVMTINDFTTAFAVVHLVTLARWRPPLAAICTQTVTWGIKVPGPSQ